MIITFDAINSSGFICLIEGAKVSGCEDGNDL
jgi:hypothetical protein